MATYSESVATTDTVAVASVDMEKLRALRQDYETEIWRTVVGGGIVAAPEKADKRRGERLLADYVTLAVNLAKANSEELYRSAGFGLVAYQHGKWGVAESVARNVRFATSTTAAISEVMRGLVGFVLAAVSLSYFAAVPIIFLQDDALIGMRHAIVRDPEILIGTGFGILGSIVSLLLRLPEFEVMRGRSREFLFLTGLTLPIVGGTFAAVISALFASHVISFSLSGVDAAKPDIRLFFLIGFLSGFSERFSRGLLTSVENRLVASLARTGGAPSVAARAIRTRRSTRTREGAGPAPGGAAGAPFGPPPRPVAEPPAPAPGGDSDQEGEPPEAGRP